MTSRTGEITRASRQLLVKFIAILLTIAVSSAGLYLFARDPDRTTEIRNLINPAYKTRRPGGGRLYESDYRPFSAPPAPPAPPAPQTDLTKAQILLLRYPNSETKQRLQGSLYLASDNWQDYIDTALHFSAETLKDAGILNDLGTSFLALSEKEPIYLLKALEQFERASELKPSAPEPRFNLVLTYRKLRLHRLAEEALEKYRSIDAGSLWYRELTSANTLDQAPLRDQLRLAVESNDSREAERIFGKNPDLFRQVIRQYGSVKNEDSPAVLGFIAAEMERRYGDKTFSAMIAPLFTDRRDAIIALRQFVTKGAESYLHGDLTGSLKEYALAQEIADQTDSFFDRLWIALNKADTQIRAGEFKAARESLDHIVSVSRNNGFRWLMSKALSVYGSTLKLAATYRETLELVSEANKIFIDLDASTDRIRPLYYLAAYQYTAGDLDEASKSALECLRLTDENDSLRISQLDWLIGFILYNKELIDKAIPFEKESRDQIQKLPYPSFQANTATTLGQLYESISDHKNANEYLGIADSAFHKMPPGFDKTRIELWLGIVKAKIALKEKQY